MDPTTGFTVDPVNDPVDFANVLAGQPTNLSMEAGAAAMAQAQAAQQLATQSMQAMLQSANQSFAAPDDSAPAAPKKAVLQTPKPAFAPNGGRFQGSVQVTITDKDSRAVVHYTLDGSKPTAASPVYTGPLTVTAKTRLRALATKTGTVPSGVLTKTFTPKM